VGFACLLFLTAPLKRESTLEVGASTIIPSETRKERDMVYSAIRDLEDDFDNGILSEQDYDNFRAELRAKAIALLQHEKEEEQESASQQQAPPSETSTPEPSTPEPLFCSQCGNALQPAHRFCPQCGTASRAEGDTPA
jgi:hypothetical protein